MIYYYPTNKIDEILEVGHNSLLKCLVSDECQDFINKEYEQYEASGLILGPITDSWGQEIAKPRLKELSRKLYICLHINEEAVSRESLVKLDLVMDNPLEGSKIDSLDELLEIAEEAKYGFNKQFKADINFLIEMAPIIEASGIATCVQQGEKPDPDFVAKDAIRFTKALIREINKEIY